MNKQTGRPYLTTGPLALFDGPKCRQAAGAENPTWDLGRNTSPISMPPARPVDAYVRCYTHAQHRPLRLAIPRRRRCRRRGIRNRKPSTAGSDVAGSVRLHPASGWHPIPAMSGLFSQPTLIHESRKASALHGLGEMVEWLLTYQANPKEDDDGEASQADTAASCRGLGRQQRFDGGRKGPGRHPGHPRDAHGVPIARPGRARPLVFQAALDPLRPRGRGRSACA